MAEDIGSSAPADSLPESDLTFDELYDQFATDVLRVSYYYLGDRQRAEDVTQDVFVRYLQNRPVLFAGREKSWLLKVALNRCRDLWRSAWLKKVVLGHPSFELFPADDEIGRAADSIALAEAVNSLAPDFKEVVLLHYYQGYGVSEIAGIASVIALLAMSALISGYSSFMFRGGQIIATLLSVIIVWALLKRNGILSRKLR